MADFILTPESISSRLAGEEVVKTDENSNDNSRIIASSPLGATKTPTINQADDDKILINTSTTSAKRPLEESSPEVSSTEKRLKEQEESERLAWQLMQEESMNAYQMQVDYMRANPELFSEEDMAALGAVLQEPHQNDDEEDDEVEEDDSAEWTYEQLLELGQSIGDVKTERWKMRSDKVISALPKRIYKEHVEQMSKESVDCDCPVCMESFENDQEVIVLPCAHFFHVDCSKGWLMENNSCPLCKKKITNSP